MSANPATPVSGPPAATELKLVPALPSPVVARPPASPAVRHRSRHWILIVLAAALAWGAVELWRASRIAPEVRYVTAPVTLGTITRAITASGSVNPEITIQVGTYVSGVIQDLRCDYNTQVHKGQLCATIDPRPYQSVVDQDRANLSTAKAQLAKDQTTLNYAKLTYDRTVGLRERGVVSQDTLDSAKSSLDQAAAQVDLDRSTIEQRQASLDAGLINLAYTKIVSPVDGTVVARSVTMGQTVAASFQTPTLFLIATDLTKMQVDANVSESDIGGIAVGNPATFTVEAFPSHVFEGRVTQVRQAPQTVQNVVTYDVVVSVPNPDLLLKPGMTATVRVIIDRRDAVLRVPDHALRYSPGGLAAAAERTAGAAQRGTGSAHVWVLRDGRPADVPVTIGLDDDTYAEVLSGDLKAGDQVVTAEQTVGGSTATPFRFFRL